MNAQKYKLYKILPIPTIHENKFVWINTKEQLLLASVNRQFYQFIKDMTDCIPYGTKQVICDNPTHWYTSTKSNCIWDIFNQLPREKCEIYETPSEPFVMGLDNNQFIYVLSDPIKITIVCGDTVTHDWLTGEGMLSLQSKCMISNENMQLNSKSSFGNLSELIVPKLNIVKEWALSLSTNREQIINNITLGSANFTELERKINETKNNLHLIKPDNNLDFHHITNYSISTLMFVLFLIIVIFKKRIVKAIRIKNSTLDNISMKTIDPELSAPAENVE